MADNQQANPGPSRAVACGFPETVSSPPEAPIPKLIKIAEGFEESYLQCFLCGELVNPHFYWFTCGKGHKTCSSCKAGSLEKTCLHRDSKGRFDCGTNHKCITNSPNKLLMGYNNSQISCRFKVYGCPEIVFGKFYRKHEVNCPFNPLTKKRNNKPEPEPEEIVLAEELILSKPGDWIMKFLRTHPGCTDEDFAEELECTVSEFREMMGVGSEDNFVAFMTAGFTPME